MNFLIENWYYPIGILVAGFVLGLVGRWLIGACSALMNFEYIQGRAKEQANFIEREYHRVMGQERNTETFEHFRKRFSELELEVERIRRGLPVEGK